MVETQSLAPLLLLSLGAVIHASPVSFTYSFVFRVLFLFYYFGGTAMEMKLGWAAQGTTSGFGLVWYGLVFQNRVSWCVLAIQNSLTL